MRFENNFKLNIIQHPIYENGIITGEMLFPPLRRIIMVEIDPELQHPNIDNFNQLAGVLKVFIKHFTPESYNNLVENVVDEITNNSFEQENCKAKPEDYKRLKNSLHLQRITVFPEGYILKYTAENIFPDNKLIVELTSNFEIDDLALYD